MEGDILTTPIATLLLSSEIRILWRLLFLNFYGLKNNFILGFNLVDEVFSIIPLPELFHQQSKSWTFSVMDEQLSIIVCLTSTIEPLTIELWILRSLFPGVDVIWAKIKTIDLCHHISLAFLQIS